MAVRLGVLLVVPACVAAQGAAAAPDRLDLTGYRLTFDDEFNSFERFSGQAGTWETQFFWRERSLPQLGDRQYYSDATVGIDPFELRNGALNITAAPGPNRAGLPYNSGIITSFRSFSQAYGYFEMRAKLPQGRGMGPAFWMLPADGSKEGEIDVLEAFGAPNQGGEGGANQIHWALHLPGTNVSNWTAVPSDIYGGYHSYGVDWEPDTTKWYFDGQEIGRVKTPAALNRPMYLIVELTVGTTWAGPADGETATMEIDYIRAYAKAPHAMAIAWQSISSPDGADTAPRGVISAGPKP